VVVPYRDTRPTSVALTPKIVGQDESNREHPLVRDRRKTCGSRHISGKERRH